MPRTPLVSMRWSPEILDLARRLAKEDGTTVSELVRDLLEAEAARREERALKAKRPVKPSAGP